MNYGTIIKKLREEQNKTQQEIASILGIARQTYNHYEIQDSIIPLKHLNNLANYYNVSIDYIFDFTNLTNYPTPKNNIEKSLTSIRLKEFRKEHKITQEKLAKILNISRSTIAEYERGTNIIATPFLYTICKKFNISADYLLGKTDSPKYLK